MLGNLVDEESCSSALANMSFWLLIILVMYLLLLSANSHFYEFKGQKVLTNLLSRARGFCLSVGEILSWRKKVWTKTVWAVFKAMTSPTLSLKHTTLLTQGFYPITTSETEGALHCSAPLLEQGQPLSILDGNNQCICNKHSKHVQDNMDDNIAWKQTKKGLLWKKITIMNIFFS